MKSEDERRRKKTVFNQITALTGRGVDFERYTESIVAHVFASFSVAAACLPVHFMKSEIFVDYACQ